MFKLLFAGLASSVLAYSKCDPKNYPYSGQTVSVPIQQTSTLSVPVNQIQVLVSVAGSIKIIDGCTFAVQNLAFAGPSFIQFVGKKAGDATGASAVLLTQATVPTTVLLNAQYTLVQSAGNWVSFYDFDIIELFDPASKAVIGTATLPAKNTVVTTTAAGAATGGSSATAAAAAAQNTAKASDSTKATLAGISAFVCLAALL
ncbi:hypothetical protein HDV01_007502 [Terramyces sp. JEL0728]|nr:hypothetical protein HDV01_007502 [Terramyces sp. JEL0728]